MYLTLFAEILVFLTFLPGLFVAGPRSEEEFKRWSLELRVAVQSLATGILIHHKTDFVGSWCRVSLIFVLVFYTSLNSRGYKIKLKTTLYTALSIDIDAYYWDTQGVATFFNGVKCPGYRDLNKYQIPTHPGLNSCQMPGGCPGGGWALLDLTHT